MTFCASEALLGCGGGDGAGADGAGSGAVVGGGSEATVGGGKFKLAISPGYILV